MGWSIAAIYLGNESGARSRRRIKDLIAKDEEIIMIDDGP